LALKIELKPNERLMIGDCVVTNAGRRTRLTIEGRAPILREKDIMTPNRASSPAKRLYLVVQRMYTSRHPQEHLGSYFRMADNIAKAGPSSRRHIERINNLILTGELYKALKEARKLIDHKEDVLSMHYASKAYTNVARETATPRELEASLLLKAAAKLQAAYDTWKDRKPAALDEAILYNRRLWTVFMDAVMSNDNKLPAPVRQNIANLGVFVMGETYSLMTKPKPDHLTSLIAINRDIATGLRGKA